MRKVALLSVLILLAFSVSSSYGQKKVKYKDIFALLSNKQYEEAELFLENYIKENDDNPNAYLYMGIIYQEKSGKDDVLKGTPMVLAHIDSAIYFYLKAYSGLTEKEVKRNSEYYQMYNRRDLRTGEFGVKLSDVQFDLEKRRDALREKTDRIKMIKHFFDLSDTLYKKSNALFVSIQKQFPGEKEFYLRADSSTVDQLAKLATRFDSAMNAFEQYKSSIPTVGKIGYNQNLKKKDIVNFKEDGTSVADFYQNELTVWDYKTFAIKAKDAIEKDIFPIRENLIAYDIEINKLHEKLGSDSVSVKSDLTKLIDRLLMEQLKKYDENPLPMDIFSVKIADLTYRSALLEDQKYRDSSDVHFQLGIAKKELHLATMLDSLATRLANRDLDADAGNYADFIKNTYRNTTVLKSFRNVMKEYAEREKGEKAQALLNRQNSLQWMVVNTDSIPLFIDHTFTKFCPLAIVEERYTSGIQLQDSLNASGYFYSITPSRIPDIKITFPVDKNAFRPSQLKNARTLTYSDAAGQLYYVLMYSENATKEKYPATLAKIYKSDGLAWSKNYNLNFVPKEIGFRADTGELIIKADAMENVIDKNGKVVVK